MKRDTAWPDLPDYCVLKSFPQQKPPVWEEYLREEREYWGEDRISGAHSADWPWEGSEAKWLEKVRNEFQTYRNAVLSWHGLFRVGDRIAVVKTDKANVVKLCRETDGKTTWGETLELWLYKEIGFFPPKRSLRCSIIGFGSSTDGSGDPTWSRQWEDCPVHIDLEAKAMLLGKTFLDIS